MGGLVAFVRRCLKNRCGRARHDLQPVAASSTVPSTTPAGNTDAAEGDLLSLASPDAVEDVLALPASSAPLALPPAQAMLALTQGNVPPPPPMPINPNTPVGLLAEIQGEFHPFLCLHKCETPISFLFLNFLAYS
jgi:hypothetical protein